jgi:hypothetical protein
MYLIYGVILFAPHRLCIRPSLVDSAHVHFTQKRFQMAALPTSELKAGRFGGQQRNLEKDQILIYAPNKSTQFRELCRQQRLHGISKLNPPIGLIIFGHTIQTRVVRFNMSLLYRTVLYNQRISLGAVTTEDRGAIKGEIQCFGERQAGVSEKANLKCFMSTVMHIE